MRNESERPDLGRCCCCGGYEDVRNIVTLDHKCAAPGTGWSCVVCNLPADGAIYVCCDACLEGKRQPNAAVVGYPGEDIREPIEATLGRAAFNHIIKFHLDEAW
jgi:hypothetical protein